MKFLGDEAISAPTRTSARSVLLTAAILVMVQVDWVDLEELKVFEVRIAEGRAIAALQAFTAFLMAAHVVQWWGDYLSYRNWNTIGSEIQQMASWGGRPDRTKLDAVLRELVEMLQAAPENSSIMKMSKEERDAVRTDLQVMARSVDVFGTYAWFYIWIWYGTLPILAGTLAIVWSWNA
jgi:hypothetical protein